MHQKKNTSWRMNSKQPSILQYETDAEDNHSWGSLGRRWDDTSLSSEAFLLSNYEHREDITWVVWGLQVDCTDNGLP